MITSITIAKVDKFFGLYKYYLYFCVILVIVIVIVIVIDYENRCP